MAGLSNTSHDKTGFGLPPSLMHAKLSSEFSLTGTKIFPASSRRESINKYGGFGGSEIKQILISITLFKRRKTYFFDQFTQAYTDKYHNIQFQKKPVFTQSVTKKALHNESAISYVFFFS